LRLPGAPRHGARGLFLPAWGRGFPILFLPAPANRAVRPDRQARDPASGWGTWTRWYTTFYRVADGQWRVGGDPPARRQSEGLWLPIANRLQGQNNASGRYRRPQSCLRVRRRRGP